MLNDQDLDRLLNEKEVAARLAVSVATVRRRRLLGKPPIARKIGSAVRYRLSDLEAFLDTCPTIGGPRVGK